MANINYQIVTEKDPLNMRSAANSTASVITTIPRGYVVTTDILEVPTNGFLKITYNGKTGFVSTQYIKYTTLPVGQQTIDGNNASGGSNNTANSNTNINNQNQNGMTLTENAKKYLKYALIFAGVGIIGYVGYKTFSKKEQAVLPSDSGSLNGFTRRRSRKKSKKTSKKFNLK